MNVAGAVANQVETALADLTQRLLGQLNSHGHWSGELSSSALSTAVATIALGRVDAANDRHLVQRGLQWLAQNANPDGGWGDTIRSKSNISTTALCWAAFGAAQADQPFADTVAGAEAWLRNAAGSLENLPSAIAARYGRDRTFSVPILMTLALSGRLGSGGWRKVPSLPFELATFPRAMFGALKLPVVSYALPALIAIGQVIHHHAPSRNPLPRLVRNLAQKRTLRILSELQPSNGGFLEATPLTAFVTMSLAAMGEQNHVVAFKGAAFLRDSIRGDGSWPIDTNLATWVTTLSIKALAHQPAALNRPQRETLRTWLLAQQYQTIHPYTGAAPGGWAWTDLPGGVPDADDTAGALLALHHLGDIDATTIKSAEAGANWLINLQNGDGGIPTFCRGWGTLPFDRSTPELTAHALRAWTIWKPHLSAELQKRIDTSTTRALRFLTRSQKADGSFHPLWFGNEHNADDENPVYGTAQVLIALHELRAADLDIPENLASRAAHYLQHAQRSNGGWGGAKNIPESIEETALALEALTAHKAGADCLQRATARLAQLLSESPGPAPIGFYFARLWYYEKLYPLIFAVSALGARHSDQR